jgi:hypothetical protein
MIDFGMFIISSQERIRAVILIPFWKVKLIFVLVCVGGIDKEF